MDPNACWKELAALHTVESDKMDMATVERCCELAESLHGWLMKDGFPPRITGNPVFDHYVAFTVCADILGYDVPIYDVPV